MVARYAKHEQALVALFLYDQNGGGTVEHV